MPADSRLFCSRSMLLVMPRICPGWQWVSFVPCDSHPNTLRNSNLSLPALPACPPCRPSQYDEPVGKNDGSAKGGKRYFTCPQGYGGFVRPSLVRTGEEFPPFDEDFSFDSGDEL